MMNVSKEMINEQNAVLKLVIEKNDYEERVNKVLKDYKRKANVPGFRPGMVPFGMVKKMYGTAVLVDEINKMVSEQLSSYIYDEKLNILGEPLPNKEMKTVDFEKDEVFEFLFDVAFAPEFEVKLSKKDKVPYYKILVDNETIDKHVENYLKRFGGYEDVEVIEDKELVKGTLVELNEAGEITENGIVNDNATLSIDLVKDAKQKKLFLAKKIGDEVIFNPSVAFPNDYEVAAILGIKKEEAEKGNKNFKLKITEIKKFVDSEINQDFFDKVFDAGTVTSIEEFRTKISEDIQSNFAFDSEYKFMIDTRDKVVEKTEMPLPEEFLLRWVKTTNEKLSSEQIDKDFPMFLKDLKWQLIKEKFVKDLELKVSEEDLLAHAKTIASMQFKQYGINFVPDEHLTKYAQDLLKKEDDRRKYAEKKFEDKVVEAIKEQIKVDEKEVSIEEFNKMFEA
ncbi:MAG: trigger factor [Bacteroidales bacterium]|nr:trigger factor [Bacteroidales bacterium]